MSEADFDIVIIGAGPAGLSAAIEAERQGRDAVLLEAEETPGGLTRSFEQDGYTFDCSGHLLHLSDPAALALVEQATPPQAWNRVSRNSVIYLDGAIVPYPFQQHLAYAPEQVRRECLDLLPKQPPRKTASEYADFGEWIEANLGAGIGRHFMVPYNEKLSTVPVSELTCEWLGRFVPQPSLEEIRAGGESKRAVETGYNRSFLYPASGGIATLSSGLAQLVPNLLTNARVAEVDTERRRVSTADGRSFGYQSAVLATIPLPRLASIVTPFERSFDAAALLRANSVTCVNLGLKRANPTYSQYQWIYLPEERFSAYRVGFYARFAEAMAPAGRESVYVEIAHEPGRDQGELVEQAIADLSSLGVIEGAGDVETVLAVLIECAYVIHDHNASAVKASLRQALARRDIHLAGRYASWEYSAMENAIVDGMAAARQIAAAA
ncbi:MAG: FAD-dependent oxidoreductase [Solirubrobacterales bacterium]